MKNLFLPLLVSGTLAMPVAASAQQLYDATDLLDILEAAKGIGSASLTKDSTGDPKIDGKTEGINYSVLFYGCKNGRDCDDIQFQATWDVGSVTPKKLNDWHRDHRFGKAYIHGDIVAITYAVNIDYGVSKKNLEDQFSWWNRIAKEFRDDVLAAK